MRKIKFQNGYCYHVYNCGVDSPCVDKLSNRVKRKVFKDKKDYIRFFILLKELNRHSPVASLHQLRINQAKKPLDAFGSFEKHFGTF